MCVDEPFGKNQSGPEEEHSHGKASASVAGIAFVRWPYTGLGGTTE